MNHHAPSPVESQKTRLGVERKKPHEIVRVLVILITLTVLLLGAVIALANNEKFWAEVTGVPR